MYIDTYDHVSNAGQSTMAILESIVEVNLLAMQKVSELQLIFVSTQMDHAMDQLKLLENFNTTGHLSPVGTASDVRQITRKVKSQPAVSKDKTTRRKTRKRNK